MIKVSIIGATGYTGSELLRYLIPHQEVELMHLTSRSHADTKVDSYYPFLKDSIGKQFTELKPDTVFGESDVVFICLPHGHSMELAATASAYDVKIIDLGADFRLKNIDVYEQTYNVEQAAPNLLKDFVYGLPEKYRDDIKDAKYIANPGCFVTSALLGMLPAVNDALVDEQSIIIDSKTGVSGAGRSASVDKLLTELMGNFKAYNPLAHRHIPEIEQELNSSSENAVQVQFTPHLIPTERGIFSTIYATVKDGITEADIIESYTTAYEHEPFVHVLNQGQLPQMKHVAGTNNCQLAVQLDERTGRLIVLSVIDNLGKGAAGQAVQNMNIMFGLPEKSGLNTIAMMP